MHILSIGGRGADLEKIFFVQIPYSSVWYEKQFILFTNSSTNGSKTAP